MSRNAFVPMSWITSDLNGEALRTLILISTYANGETGKCNVRNPKLASMLGKSDRSVRNDISSIVKAGFMSIENGDSRDRILTIESPEWFQRPGRKTSGFEGANPEEKLPGQPGRKTSTYPEEKLPGNPEEKLPGPNKNTILEHNFQHSEKSERLTEESKPTTLAADCSLALADLAQPKFDLAPDLKRSVEQLNLHAWIQMLATHGMDPKDWRIRATIEQLHGKGKMASPFGLARKIFNDLPETEPPKTNGHVNGHGKYRQNEPTHVPNLMPKRVKSRNENILTGYWNRLAELPIPGVELKVWADRMHSTPTDLEPAAFEAAMERILTEATETVK